MSEQLKTKANEIFNTLCAALDAMNIKCTKKDDVNLCVEFGVPSNDIPIRLGMNVQTEEQQVTLFSRLPINISTDTYFEICLAVNTANGATDNGYFDFDCETGSLFFRMVNTYKDSQLGVELFKDMVENARITVDRYNDRFLKLARNLISFREFLALEQF